MVHDGPCLYNGPELSPCFIQLGSHLIAVLHCTTNITVVQERCDGAYIQGFDPDCCTLFSKMLGISALSPVLSILPVGDVGML